jgi:hypothetical protein
MDREGIPLRIPADSRWMEWMEYVEEQRRKEIEEKSKDKTSFTGSMIIIDL